MLLVRMAKVVTVKRVISRSFELLNHYFTAASFTMLACGEKVFRGRSESWDM